MVSIVRVVFSFPTTGVGTSASIAGTAGFPVPAPRSSSSSSSSPSEACGACSDFASTTYGGPRDLNLFKASKKKAMHGDRTTYHADSRSNKEKALYQLRQEDNIKRQKGYQTAFFYTIQKRCPAGALNPRQGGFNFRVLFHELNNKAPGNPWSPCFVWTWEKDNGNERNRKTQCIDFNTAINFESQTPGAQGQG
ncbi:hypothetical protein B0H16DRAFT_1468783 [Mycena metata]|uniref:Uncharacterized protein n=1 Tax=Mycena metata TaxID=1033252 RepID=A0AAD7HZU1_9AGAR|nr:hypothetical protein B0H16DRAFT_1468783 [Mycena metata]